MNIFFNHKWKTLPAYFNKIAGLIIIISTLGNMAVRSGVWKVDNASQVTGLAALITLAAVVLMFFTKVADGDPSGEKYLTTKPGLLPTYYKIIGIFILIFAISAKIFFLFLSGFNNQPAYFNADVVFALLTLGMFLIAISKEREEDELLMSIRLRSIFIAFSAGVLFSIMTPVYKILAPPLEYTMFWTEKQFFYALFCYLILFYFYKRRL